MSSCTFFVLFLGVLASTTSYTVEVLKGPGTLLQGESPHWDENKQELLFVDVAARLVYKYSPATGNLAGVRVGGNVSPVIPIAGQPNQYLIGTRQELKILEWDGISSEPSSLETIETLNEAPLNAINDGKCDAAGRFFVGTYDLLTSAANFYQLDSDGQLVMLLSNLSISNGMAWSADNETLFHVDSVTRQLHALDYDITTGSVSNRRSVFDLAEHGISGLIDGITIDSDGNIWAAILTGAKILHIDPVSGSLLRTLDFEGQVSQITSVAFGGPNLETLFVTTASLLVSQPLAGALLAIHDLGVRGAGPGVPFTKNF